MPAEPISLRHAREIIRLQSLGASIHEMSRRCSATIRMRMDGASFARRLDCSGKLVSHHARGGSWRGRRTHQRLPDEALHEFPQVLRGRHDGALKREALPPGGSHQTPADVKPRPALGAPGADAAENGAAGAILDGDQAEPPQRPMACIDGQIPPALPRSAGRPSRVRRRATSGSAMSSATPSRSSARHPRTGRRSVKRSGPGSSRSVIDRGLPPDRPPAPAARL